MDQHLDQHRVVAPARRALTRAELQAILDAITAAATPTQILEAAVAGVVNALLTDQNLTLATLPAAWIPITHFAIPEPQWTQLCQAAVHRAGPRGVELSLELASRMPSTYPDPTAPTIETHYPDPRPPQLTLTLTGAATDVIAAAGDHIAALARHYGPASAEHTGAAASLARCLPQLFTRSFGDHTTVRAEPPLSLIATTATGYTIAMIFHPTLRRCLAPGCPITLTHPDQTTAINGADDGHIHQPSYPFGAPAPGTWSLHT